MIIAALVPYISPVDDCIGREVDIQEIRQAWELRQEKVRAARFEWDFKSYIPALASAVESGQWGTMADDIGGPIDANGEGRGAISIDGPQLRVEYEEPTWVPGRADPVMCSLTSVRKGAIVKRFFPSSMDVDRQLTPEGIITKPIRDSSGLHVQFFAIALIYRPLSDAVGEKYPIEAFKILQQDALLDGRMCVVAGTSPTAHEIAHQIWVDPEREYLPLRLRKYHNANLILECKIDYDGPQPNWTPKEWLINIFRGGSDDVSLRTTAKVRLAQINPKFDASEFDFEFPPGTRVTDLTSDLESVYIVREGGERRQVLPQEIRADISYEDLLNSDAGEAVPSGDRLLRFTMLIVNLSVLILLLGLVLRRRFLRSPSIAQ